MWADHVHSSTSPYARLPAETKPNQVLGRKGKAQTGDAVDLDLCVGQGARSASQQGPHRVYEVEPASIAGAFPPEVKNTLHRGVDLQCRNVLSVTKSITAGTLPHGIATCAHRDRDCMGDLVSGKGH